MNPGCSGFIRLNLLVVEGAEMRWNWIGSSCAFAAMAFSAMAVEGANRWGLQMGSVELKSSGPLAFGPEGVLFIGDPKAATVVAINTGDTQKSSGAVSYNLESLDASLQKALNANSVAVQDLAVNPISGSVYLTVTATSGEKATPALVRIAATGQVQNVELSKIECATVALPNAPEDKVVNNGRRSSNPRNESITDIAFADGRLLVSGLSNGTERSNVWEIALPFTNVGAGTPVEIYHGAHGAVETSSPVRTFIPLSINGEPSILAGYTCTPLVRFSLEELKGDSKVRGTTVAELGNMNQPLDIVQYRKDGQEYLLMANTKRGVMKISTRDIGRDSGITERVGGGGTAGQDFETITGLQGVVQLDRLSDTQAVILVKNGETTSLKTIELP